MSIPTMNWALGQRLETHAQQILLYVIADSTDPAGVTRHCDPDYMAEHARMTRATMFRRLAELEELGLLARAKFYSEKGAPIYEIRLNLALQVNLPLKRRRLTDDEGAPDDEGEPGDHGGEERAPVTWAAATVPTAPPESHGETLAESHAATLVPTKVSGEAAAQSHSCDRISPPDPKNLPPTPLAGGALSKREVEQSEKRGPLWQRFLGDYPGITTMDQHAAREEFDTLSLDDAEWAVSVLPALKADLVKLRKPPKNAHLWLRKAMFRNFPRAKIEPPPPDAAWIVQHSPADQALRFVRLLAKVPNPFVQTRADGSRGYLHPTEPGADLLAMNAFVDQARLHWIGYPRGSEEFGAWQARFRAWIGQPIPTEPGSDCIRVPCRWPPKKDGTIYPDDAPSAQEENTHA